MPNVMIFGKQRSEFNYSIRDVINRTMCEIGLGQEAITTFVYSEAFSCGDPDKCMPFIRVVTTGGNLEAEKIIRALAKALQKFDDKFDFEWQALQGFHTNDEALEL